MPAFESETIGDWTVDRLIRFLQQVQQESPPANIPNLICDTLTTVVEAKFNDQVQFNNIQFTIGANGTASALTANPAGYIRIKDYTGQQKIIPYYNA